MKQFESKGVNALLAQVHAAVVLAQDATLVKACPHYPQLREAALHVDRDTFSLDRLAYHQLYRDVAHGAR